MVHRIPYLLSVPRLVDWRWRRTYFAVYSLGLTLGLGSVLHGCSGPPDAGDTSPARESIPELRVDGRVESLTDAVRLETLYLPNVPPESARHVSLTTDGRGHAEAGVMLPPAHCLHALLQSDASETPHDLSLRVRTAMSEEGGTTRTLAISRARSTALPLAGVCPSREEGLSLALDVRGTPSTSYTLRLYLTASDELERGLYAQGRRDLPGFHPHGPLQEDTLAENQRGAFPLAVTPERCVAVVGYSDATMPDLDARFVSLTGEPLALEVATDRAAVLGPYCAFDPEVIRVEFRAYEGEGRFRWQVWESPVAVGRRLLQARQQSPTGALPAGLRRELQQADWPLPPPRKASGTR